MNDATLSWRTSATSCTEHLSTTTSTNATVICIPYRRDALNRTRWVDAEFGTNLKVAYLDRVFVV